jgi:hypothetical protein
MTLTAVAPQTAKAAATPLSRALDFAEVPLVLFLSFNTLWNLVYLEKDFPPVFWSLVLLCAVFTFSFIRNFQGLYETGFRLDTLLPSLLKGLPVPLIAAAGSAVFAVVQKAQIAVPHAEQWLTFAAAGIAQQFIFLGFFTTATK